jgi:hypothetical protein
MLKNEIEKKNQFKKDNFLNLNQLGLTCQTCDLRCDTR